MANKTAIKELQAEGFTVLTPAQSRKLTEDLSRVYDANLTVSDVLANADPKTVKTAVKASGSIKKIVGKRIGY